MIIEPIRGVLKIYMRVTDEGELARNLACLAQKTWHFGSFQFCECVHCSQGPFLLESVYVDRQGPDQPAQIRTFLFNPCPAEPGYTLPLQTV